MKNIKSALVPYNPALTESAPARMPQSAGGLKNNVRRNMYRWHRIIGLLTIVPVIFWTTSGLMHPFMSHWFKPRIAHEFVPPQTVQPNQYTLSLPEVLQRNGINRLRNFRLVQVGGQPYYQVKLANHTLVYYHGQTGKILSDGDRQYARQLARYFLGDPQSAIRSIEPVEDFTPEYRYVNRLLPVYKISFDRDDHMDMYVETGSSRLANFNEVRRKTFLWVFNNFHNWDFLERISNNTLRYTVMLTFLSIIILSAVSGLVIYGFMWKKFRQPRNAADRVGFLRKYHRQIGLATALVTVTFAFSGAYHTTRKFTPDDRHQYRYQPVVEASALQANFWNLPLNRDRVTNVSLAAFQDSVYYQVHYRPEKSKGWDGQQLDKAEKMFGNGSKMADPNLAYYHAQTTRLLPDGAIVHAKALTEKFWEQQQSGGDPACCEETGTAAETSTEGIPELDSTEVLTTFSREYGFINKRLPVVKLALNTPDHLTYYVEPASGHLAARIVDNDRREGLSFAVLHKFFLMDWAGKNIRDLTMMVSAAGLLVTSLFGLALLVKKN